MLALAWSGSASGASSERARGGWLAWSRTALWIAVPASLLFSFSHYVPIAIAFVPSFGIVALCVYALTLDLAFDRVPGPLPAFVGSLGSVGLVAVLALFTTGANSPAELLVPLHVLVFFACCFACHARVAALRPADGGLGAWLFAVAAGGVVGGFVAGWLPHDVTARFVHYPVALLLAALVLVPGSARRRGAIALSADLLVPAALFVAGTWAVARFVPGSGLGPAIPWLPAAFYAVSANERGSVFATRLASAFAASLFLPSFPLRVFA